MPIPASTLSKMKEFEELYKRFEEAKKLRERYPALKRRLEALRESRPVQTTNLKDVRAVEHFEFLQRQHEAQLEQIERNLQVVLKQFEQSKQNLVQKNLYVEDKLQKARDRVDTYKHLKTKEEILLEKQLVELIQEHITLEPREDLAQAFPGHKELQLQLPTSGLIKDQVIEEPKPTPAPPSGPKVKRKPKEVSVVERVVEELPAPTPPPSPPPEAVPEPPRSQKASLYGNLVQNSKLQRGASTR